MAFLDQVQAYFQVRPELANEGVYADAHAELDRLLPGDGPLLDRYGRNPHYYAGFGRRHWGFGGAWGPYW